MLATGHFLFIAVAKVHWAAKSSNVAALDAMTRANRALLSLVRPAVHHRGLFMSQFKVLQSNTFLLNLPTTLPDCDMQPFDFWHVDACGTT